MGEKFKEGGPEVSLITDEPENFLKNLTKFFVNRMVKDLENKIKIRCDVARKGNSCVCSGTIKCRIVGKEKVTVEM